MLFAGDNCATAVSRDVFVLSRVAVVSRGTHYRGDNAASDTIRRVLRAFDFGIRGTRDKNETTVIEIRTRAGLYATGVWETLHRASSRNVHTTFIITHRSIRRVETALVRTDSVKRQIYGP